MAGWVTAPLGKDHGAALRADLDRLMVQGIIPDRAGRLQPRDMKQDVRGDAVRVGSAEGRLDAVAPGPWRGFESHPLRQLIRKANRSLRRARWHPVMLGRFGFPRKSRIWAVSEGCFGPESRGLRPSGSIPGPGITAMVALLVQPGKVYLRKQPVGDRGVDRLGPEGMKL